MGDLTVRFRNFFQPLDVLHFGPAAIDTARPLRALNFSIGALAALSCSTQALAQADAQAGPTSSAEPEYAAGEIVVTAQKREQNLSDVPMSISAISGDALADRGVQNVQDLAKLTPGLSFVDSGASIPVYSLRGVGFFDTSLAARPTVSVYVDQIPLPFSAMTIGATLDLERVEVLKGPQGTLFGQNATGGAINYIAAKPTDYFTGGVSLGYGRFNTIEAEAHLSGPVAPDLNVRIAGKILHGDDWQYSYTRNDKHGDKKLLQGRFIADWQPSDTVKFELNLNGFKDNSDTQAAQFLELVPLNATTAPVRIPDLIGYPRPPESNRAADWGSDPDFESDNGFYQASLRGDVELNDRLTLTSLSSFQHLSINQLTDQDGTAITNTKTLQDGTIKSFSQELRLAYDDDGVHGIIGLNYQYDKAVENNRFDFPYNTAAYALIAFGPFPGLRQLSDQRFNTYAAFANLDLDVSDTITVHGGARYTQADFSYEACSADIDGADVDGITGLFNLFRSRVGLGPLPTLEPNGCISVDADFNLGPVTGNFDENNLSWRVGADWKPTPETLIYANVSRGYKAGSLPVVAAVFADQLRPIKQESVLAYEVGVKTSTPDRVLSLSAAAFYYDYSDKQLKGRIVTDPNLFGPQEALVNVPKSRITGVEAQVDLRPVAGLALSLGGTYLDSKVQSDFENFTILGTLTNFKGQEFPYTPKYQLVADGQYSWPIGTLEGFVGASLVHKSKTKAGFGTTELLDIDSYTTLDLRAGIGADNGSWKFSAYGRNVTNEYYWTNVAKIGDVARRIAGQPMTYGVRLDYNF